MNKSLSSNFVRFGRIHLLALLCAILGSVAYGSSYAPLDDEEHTRKARSVWVGLAVGSNGLRHEDGRILTRTVFEVVETLKGVVPARVKLLHEGGAIANEAQINGFSPSFVPGAYYLVFTGESEGSLTALHGRLSAKRLWPTTQLNGDDISWTAESEQMLDEYEAIVAAQGDSGDDYRHLIVSPKEYTAAKLSTEASAGPQQKAVTATGLTEFEIPAGSPARPNRLIAGDRDQLIPYLVDLDALPAGMTEEEALMAVQNAVGAWEDATSLTFTFEGVTSFGEGANKISNDDGKLRLQLHDTYNQVGGFTTLGIGGIFANNGSYPEGGAGGRVKNQEFHIITNSYVILKHTNSTMQNAVTFEEVLGHEIGHAIGMAHSSETNLESNETLKEALMYYKSHGDGRGAALNSYDIGVARKAYPVDNTPPVAFTRIMDIVTMPSSSTLGNPEVNELRLFGYDRQSNPSALTVSLDQDQTSSTNGTFSVSDNTLLNYHPNNFTTAERLDPDGGVFYDRLTYRLEDGVNASPISRVRVISLSADSSPSPVVDGLPNNWIAEHFVGNEFQGADDDADDDGLTNLEEFLQRTDPQIPASVVRLSFDSSAQTVDEGDGQVRVGVKSNIPTARTLSFEYTVSGTAGEDDYVIRTASLHPYFYADEVTYDLIIDLTEDDLQEANETLVLTLLSVEEAVFEAPLTHVVTINDDFEAPSTYDFSQANHTVSEGDSESITSVVHVNRTGGTDEASSVDVVLLPGSTNPATLGDDLAGDTITVNFSAGDTTKAVPITLFGDSTDEPDETVSLSLDNFSSGGLGTAIPTAVITITDDDAAPSVNLSDVAVTESVGTSSIPVQLSGASERTISMTYTVAPGSAILGQDFNSTTGTLTLVPGQTSATIPFTIIDDAVDEPTESFQVTLSNLVNVQDGDKTASVTIQDNDSAPVITVGPTSGVESGSLQFTLALNVASGQTISVDFATQNGSALAGSDYVTESGTATFAPGDVIVEVVVDLIDDTLDESVESMLLLLSDPVNASLGNQSAEGTIQDNDSAPMISVGSTTATEAGSLQFALSLNAASGQTITVDFATQNGSSEAGSDYVASSGTATFAPGEVAAVVIVDLIDDTLDEPSENMVLVLSDPVNASLGSGSAEGTIQDNDSAPVISVGSTTATESGSLQFTISLDAESSRTIAVEFATQNGSAEAGSDYVASTGTATFAPGETTVQIGVDLIDDTLNEATETMSLVLSDPVNASLGSGSAEGTIQDNDSAPVISVGSTTATESGSLQFTISLDAESSRTITVEFATQNGSAEAGSDYVASTGTATFAPGETTVQIGVDLIDDTLNEATETMVLLLSDPVNASLGSGSAEGTIQDNDAAPGIMFSDLVASESNDSVSVNIQLSAASGREVSVDYTTQSGSAEAGQDFVAASGTLIISAGSTQGALNVGLLDDVVDEPNESFTIVFSGPVAATLGDTALSILIEDDDNTPVLSANDAVTDEGDGEVVIAVTLDAVSSREIGVDYFTEDGSALAGSDYAASSGRLIIPAGSDSGEIRLSIIDDNRNEVSESFAVLLADPSSASLGVSALTITVADDDELPRLSFGAMSVSESAGTLSIPVTLSAPSGREVRVDFTAEQGSAIAGTDFTQTEGTLIIASGETEAVVNVVINNDEVDEGNETFALGFLNAVAATLIGDKLTVTIEDDDPTPQLSVSNVSVGESQSEAIVEVSLSAPSGRLITVDYVTSDGTALAGNDYVAASGTVSIPVGQSSAEIRVSLVDDGLDEEEEMFFISLTEATQVTLPIDSIQVSIVDDDDSPALMVSDVQMDEGAGDLIVTFSLSEPSGRVVSFNYATEGETAMAGGDYETSSGTVPFTPGETTASLAISIIDDEVYELDETFQVILGSLSNVVSDRTTVQITIEDNDELPEVNILDDWASEGGGVSFAVEVVGPREVPVEVRYTTSDVTAVGGQDYVSASKVLIIPVDSHGEVLVQTSEDEIAEDTETFKVTLSELKNARPGRVEATGEILDRSDDVFLVFEGGQVDESAGVLSIPVSLDGLSKQRITFDYTTLDGTALAGEDYELTQGSGVFQPGQEELTLEVPINNDVLDEAPETFSVQITNIENAASGQFDGVFTIVDDDPEPDLGAITVSVSESSETALIRFELSAVSARDASVDYRTERGSALELQDFMSVEGRLTIPAGETVGELEIGIINDELNEGTEIFTLELIRSVNAQLTSEAVSLTIEDDDEPPTVSISDAEAEEGSLLRFDITLSVRSGRDVVVGYETRDGSALAGEDYRATSGELTIPAGSLTTVIEVESIDDSLVEQDEPFTVALLAPTNATVGDAEAQGMVTDNDEEPSEEVDPVVSEIILDRTTGELSMVWVGQPGQTAVLEHSEDMKTWVPIPSTEIEGNGEPQTINVELPDPTKGYYRLRVEG